ncbi:MAG: glycine oxidase ThiO [Acidobacteria bacterium]|nr:MAG: glycine oxidase ThiO [Acidobacteriota bacterium]
MGKVCLISLDSKPVTKKTRRTGSPDVVIVGGGIIGCAIALRLAEARMKVVVLDRGEPGAEASSAAAGMLAPQGESATPDTFFEFARASRDLYPEFAREVEALSDMKVGYRRDGTLLVALERLSAKAVHERAAGLAPEIRSGLFIAGDHWLDNEKFAGALVKAGRRAGVKFHTHSAATRLTARGGRVESVQFAAASKAARKSLSAGTFVLSAGCWSPELTGPLGLRLPMSPCRGQMIEFDAPQPLAHVVRAGHHYLVPRAGCRVLAGTTAEYVGFEKAVTGEGLRSILEGVMRIAPVVKSFRFRRAWSGLRPDTADHRPILGYGEINNLVFATGHFRNGILLAPITARAIADLILTGATEHPIDAYRPQRFG